MTGRLYAGFVTNLLRDPDGFVYEEKLEASVFRDDRPNWREFSVSISSTVLGRWDSFTCLSAQDARAFAQLLANAAKVADAEGSDAPGVRKLTSIMLCGKEFIIDERLRQLRSVDDPGHCFDLDGPR